MLISIVERTEGESALRSEGLTITISKYYSLFEAKERSLAFSSTPGASIPLEPMKHSPILPKKIYYLAGNFHFSFPQNFRFSSLHISDDLF